MVLESPLITFAMFQTYCCIFNHPFVSERWHSTNMLLTCLHQCWRLVHKRPSMCYQVCVVMHLKDPWLSVVRVGHHVPSAGFCLSLYSLHVPNRVVNMIQTNKQKAFPFLVHFCHAAVPFIPFVLLSPPLSQPSIPSIIQHWSCSDQ